MTESDVRARQNDNDHGTIPVVARTSGAGGSERGRSGGGAFVKASTSPLHAIWSDKCGFQEAAMAKKSTAAKTAKKSVKPAKKVAAKPKPAAAKPAGRGPQ